MSHETSMPVAHAAPPESHTTFFRQSGWLVVATVAGGFFMVATQVVANRWMELSEYGVWFALLRIFLLMSIPSAGLQIVFAERTAAAVSSAQQRQLHAQLRAALVGTFLIWLAMAGVALAGQSYWLAQLKITKSAALWVTVAIGLASLWSPILRGTLQGRQNFLGLGWVLILDGVGRFIAITIILLLGGQAAGGMVGALIGQAAAACLAAWLLWDFLSGRGEPFDGRSWLRRVVPLTLGIGSVQFMSSADVVYVQSVFSDRTPLYMAASMIGLAMVTFTTPLASVMFPKVVRSTALTQDTRALQHALGATVLLVGAAALACTLLPSLPLQVVYFSKPAYWAAKPLVPWFAWCLLPLIVANVLASNLLARAHYRVVPWMVAVATAYGLTLYGIRPRLLAMEPLDAFRTVVQTLGGFSLLLLAVTLWFSRKPANPAGAAAAP